MNAGGGPTRSGAPRPCFLSAYPARLRPGGEHKPRERRARTGTAQKRKRGRRDRGGDRAEPAWETQPVSASPGGLCDVRLPTGDTSGITSAPRGPLLAPDPAGFLTPLRGGPASHSAASRRSGAPSARSLSRPQPPGPASS